jgi:hypothetical protein
VRYDPKSTETLGGVLDSARNHDQRIVFDAPDMDVPNAVPPCHNSTDPTGCNGAESTPKPAEPAAGHILRAIRYMPPPAIASFAAQSAEKGDPMWLILSLGPDGSGLSLHFHNEAWLHLLGGTKLWLLLPPGLLDRKIAEERMTTPGPTSKAPRRSSVASALQGLQRIPPGSADAVRLVRELLVALRGSLNVGLQARGRRDEGDPLRRGGAQLCLQRGGEAMYLPPRWWHWTLNVGEALGVGFQTFGHVLSSPPAIFPQWPRERSWSFLAPEQNKL